MTIAGFLSDSPRILVISAWGGAYPFPLGLLLLLFLQIIQFEGLLLFNRKNSSAFPQRTQYMMWNGDEAREASWIVARAAGRKGKVGEGTTQHSHHPLSSLPGSRLNSFSTCSSTWRSAVFCQDLTRTPMETPVRPWVLPRVILIYGAVVLPRLLGDIRPRSSCRCCGTGAGLRCPA